MSAAPTLMQTVSIVLFVLLVIVGALGTVIRVNRRRFERRVEQEMRALSGMPPSSQRLGNARAIRGPGDMATRARSFHVRALAHRLNGLRRKRSDRRLECLIPTRAGRRTAHPHAWVGEVLVKVLAVVSQANGRSLAGSSISKETRTGARVSAYT